ncbi:HAD-IA family hydrolase [Novosphingobium sp.]|uniref:HAD-IA family hydrolase n=1 Tax=Novosphingobium sp. TaxID=1874826 RepID=UPI0027348D15|nr:HAD-IA family hydrolase [Novosphingobium sp.]MDP3905811.1 HAD-IA family hydrolase [Novosphingobium sp.]
MTVKLAVFDCDGTLVDGQGGVCASMDAAFAAVGLAAPDHHQVRRIVGLSLPQAIRLLAPDVTEAVRVEVDRAYREIFRAAREAGQLAEPLFPGIRDCLDGLRAGGWTLGVATGKSDRGLEHCLATHGITGHFVTLQTADRHPSKPHPAMLEAALTDAGADAAQAVMIGDTQYDIVMAVNAGVRAIGVDWGYHTPYELLDSGAETVVQSPAELLELLR